MIRDKIEVECSDRKLLEIFLQEDDLTLAKALTVFIAARFLVTYSNGFFGGKWVNQTPSEIKKKQKNMKIM